MQDWDRETLILLVWAPSLRENADKKDCIVFELFREVLKKSLVSPVMILNLDIILEANISLGIQHEQ